MSIIEHDQYIFEGDKAGDSVKYFDTVISYGYKENMDYLAWDAAHKFGVRVTTANMESFDCGLVYGENALDAAVYIELEHKKAYGSCEEFGRSKKMKRLMSEIYSAVELKYQVEIRVM